VRPAGAEGSEHVDVIAWAQVVGRDAHRHLDGAQAGRQQRRNRSARAGRHACSREDLARGYIGDQHPPDGGIDARERTRLTNTEGTSWT
jgi:hypothetical protein